MTTLDAGILTTVLLSIVGCYAYVHKVAGDMGKRQTKDEESKDTELRKVTVAVTDLTLAVSVRLTAIETQLGIQLPKKSGSN